MQKKAAEKTLELPDQKRKKESGGEEEREGRGGMTDRSQ